MEYGSIKRDALLTTVLAICAERVVNKIKKWWYREEDIDIMKQRMRKTINN